MAGQEGSACHRHGLGDCYFIGSLQAQVQSAFISPSCVGKAQEFLDLVQGGMIVIEYAAKFL